MIYSYIQCMATLQIRDFPDDLYEKLKKSAENDRRSISQQAIILLEMALNKTFNIERRRKAIEELKKLDLKFSSSFDITRSVREDRNR